MLVIIVVLILSATISAFFILLTLKFKAHLDKVNQKIEKEVKEKSLDELLDKYFVEEKKDVMKEKLSKISKIIAETEISIERAVKEKVKVVKEQKAQLRAQGKELEIIQKASDDLLQFETGFRKSAMPETEEERRKDMSELKDAINLLESFDQESYKILPQKTDAGLGMFYDKMSRRFISLISEQKLNSYKLVPIQRVKYHVFTNVKNLKDNDLLPILQVMKNTKLLNDIVEVNPAFQLVVFSEEKLKFTNPEKVLLTFAYDHALTTKKLMEIAKWKEDYANKVLKGLSNKGILTVLDNVINVEGFGHVEERKKWNETVDAQIKKEKQDLEEKQKRQLERTSQLKQELSKVEKAKLQEMPKPLPEEVKKVSSEEMIDTLDSISAVDEGPAPIKFDKKPMVKTLPLPQQPQKIEQKPKVPEAPKVPEKPKEPVKTAEKDKKKAAAAIKEKDDLLGVMEALDKEMEFSEAEKKAKKAKSKPSEELFEESMELEEGENDLDELVPQKILNYHEKFSLINGGFVQYEKIKEFVNQELENVPEDLIKEMLGQLIELQLINSSLKIGKNEYFLFNEIKFEDNEKKLIEFATNKNPLSKEELMKGLKWSEEQTLAAMKTLQDKKVLRIEKNEVIVPGIIQK